MNRIVVFLACLGLAACGGMERGADREAWGRLDGQPISVDQRLTTRFASDSAKCREEAAKTMDPAADPAAAKAAVVAKAQGCMSKKGYALQRLPVSAVVDTPYGPVVAPEAYGARRPAAG